MSAARVGAVGMTAYCSLLRIAKPKQGEVAYVSGAAGEEANKLRWLQISFASWLAPLLHSKL